ncbi:MAG: hypothetical protein WCE52_16600 [Candidatus Acidiferrum sp.]
MGRIDPEHERLRLATLYSGMSDGELEKVGEEPSALTELAFEILQAEMARRKLDWSGKELTLATFQTKKTNIDHDAPVAIRVYRDMTEAVTDRMLLEATGMDCYLYDENMVRLDWLWSNLLGGLKLVVRKRDAEDAEKILIQGRNEKFNVEGVGEYEQERCPKCGSMDVSCDELKKRIAGASLWLGVPIAITQRGWNCHACGHTWEVAKDVKTGGQAG